MMTVIIEYLPLCASEKYFHHEMIEFRSRGKKCRYLRTARRGGEGRGGRRRSEGLAFQKQ